MWYTTTVKKPHARNPDGEATSFPLGLNSGAGLGEEVTFASQELPAARQLSATRDLAQHPPPPSSGGWHRNGTVGAGGTAGMDTVRNHPTSLKGGKKGKRKKRGWEMRLLEAGEHHPGAALPCWREGMCALSSGWEAAAHFKIKQKSECWCSCIIPPCRCAVLGVPHDSCWNTVS